MGRRKREAGEEPVETKLVERLQDMYLAVIESEECVERIACEVGGIARDAGLDENLVTAASYMVPSKYSKYAKQFASSRKCEKIKCGSFWAPTVFSSNLPKKMPKSAKNIKGEARNVNLPSYKLATFLRIMRQRTRNYKWTRGLLESLPSHP